jgi:type VII secretion-associated serine protease mycosin
LGLRLLGAWCATVAIGCVVLTARPAAARAPECVDPGQPVTSIPWAQQMLGPERVWPFVRGDGLTIAVLDSGVDRNHPQLKGRVQQGFDAVAGSGRADDDCLGTGTQVASVIAAGQVSGVGFAGVAPGVAILPVRVIVERGSAGGVTTAAILAKGINVAVERGADVIAVSVITYQDSPALRDAVQAAGRKGVVVVAAVGDLGDPNGANPPPYPADYEGVIGVAAVGESGVRWSKSQHGDYVDIVAPGVDVIASQRVGGMTLATGTGIAIGFVAATVALIRDARGSEASATSVKQILLATAVGSGPDQQYGRGLVNPYGAVTERLARRSPTPLPAMARPAEAGTSIWASSRDLALIGTVVGLAAVILVAAVAIALPRGRRRFWRPAMAAAPPHADEPEEPGPPVQLFDEQPAT